MQNFDTIFFFLHYNQSEHPPTVDSASSPVPSVHGGCGESEAAPGGISEEPTTSPPQEAGNPSQKVHCSEREML